MPQNDLTSAGLMRLGINRISQALSIFDAGLRLAVCNRRYQEMFAFPDAYVTPGVSFEDTIRYMVCRGEYGHFDDIEAAVAARVAAARAFVPHYMERARPNGRWVSVEGSPLAQGGWVTVYTDITEVKLQDGLLRARSEELSDEVIAHTQGLALANRELAAVNAMLAEAKRELTEAEARMRLTAEMMPAHLAHVGPDLRYTYSNRRLGSILPGRPADIIGLTGREALGPQVFAKIAPALRKALAGEASVLEFSDDSSGRLIRGAFTPDQRAPGAPVTGVYILSTDVTREVQAREALMQTRKRELAAQLTSGLAHDFSNLLTIILGLQSQLNMHDLPPGAADLVSATLAAARRGGVLLGRIGSISAQREIRNSLVDMKVFSDELLMLTRAALPAQVSLSLNCAEFPRPLILDPGMLQDAALNLVLNARDAMLPAGGTITLDIRPIRDTWLEIAVRDQGPGFSPEALDRGLEPFFTTKKGEGSGLGLAMIYDHVKLAGGTTRLSNPPGGGARVILRLPLHSSDRDVLPPCLVLLIEDDTEIRAYARALLCSLGHAVAEAADLAQARSLSTLPGLGLVLSDINLGAGQDGLAFADEFHHPGGPVVALMTALPRSDPHRRQAESRFPVLQKPFELAGLSAFLSTLIPAKEPPA